MCYTTNLTHDQQKGGITNSKYKKNIKIQRNKILKMSRSSDRLSIRFTDLGLDETETHTSESEDEQQPKRMKYDYESYNPDELDPAPYYQTKHTSLFIDNDNDIIERKDCILCVYKLGDHIRTHEKPYPKINDCQMEHIINTIKKTHCDGSVEEGCIRVCSFYNESIAKQTNMYLDTDKFKPLPQITPKHIYCHFEFHKPPYEFQMLRQFETISMLCFLTKRLHDRPDKDRRNNTQKNQKR